MVSVPNNMLEEFGEQNIHRKIIVFTAGEVSARYVIFSCREYSIELSEYIKSFRELVS